MSKVWIISDVHAGHQNQTRWREGFTCADEITLLIVENYKRIVRKKDVVWFLGDTILDNKDKWLPIFKSLPGTKKMVLGNHDTKGLLKRPSLAELSEVFSDIHGLYKYKEAWLSHAPIHPDELRGKFNIHGHTHFHKINDSRYFNACVDVNDYSPVSYQWILSILKQE